MTTTEFDDVAARTADRLGGHPIDERIAAACRGSGNPAALSWLAEECEIRPGSRVVDLGSGLAGPAAWFVRHNGCSIVALDPSPGAVRGARRLFDLPVVRADAIAVPSRANAFDVALVLGVVSVVGEPERVLAEAARVAPRVAVAEHCSTNGQTVAAGGSRFPTPVDLSSLIERACSQPCECIPVTMPAPRRWSELQRSCAADDVDVAAQRDARDVDDLIASGVLVPYVAAARRA